MHDYADMSSKTREYSNALVRQLLTIVSEPLLGQSSLLIPVLKSSTEAVISALATLFSERADKTGEVVQTQLPSDYVTTA